MSGTIGAVVGAATGVRRRRRAPPSVIDAVLSSSCSTPGRWQRPRVLVALRHHGHGEPAGRHREWRGGGDGVTPPERAGPGVLALVADATWPWLASPAGAAGRGRGRVTSSSGRGPTLRSNMTSWSGSAVGQGVTLVTTAGAEPGERNRRWGSGPAVVVPRVGELTPSRRVRRGR
ncbi:hypothetical protein HBB16_02695 [Pseudonocardia sp. MCCB 268]|nr:hypothetical protein [Pseudonocardia cytotoxica]